MQTFLKVLREPLVHFAILGALLFFVLAPDNPADDDISREIIVSQGQIDSLAETWRRTWQRPPTGQELAGLVDDFIREEIFYREARTMGLDENDTVIRRRLRQKLEFLAEDFAALAQPSEADLQQYLDDHPEQYAIEPQLTFQQVFFSEDKRGAAAEQDALAALSILRSAASDNQLANAGDSLSLPESMQQVPLQDISRLFGDTFASDLAALPVGTWQGPVRSGYGLHLVRVIERQDSRIPALAEVQQAVSRDWLAEQQRQTGKAFYDALRAQYRVTIEGADAAKADAPTAVDTR